MKEYRQCFAKEILNEKRLNKIWLVNCGKRRDENFCCKRCELNLACPHKCNRVAGDCCYYFKKTEVEKTKLAYVLDPHNDYWRRGQPGTI